MVTSFCAVPGLKPCKLARKAWNSSWVLSQAAQWGERDHPCIVMRLGGCAGSGSAPAEVVPGGAVAEVAAEISGLSPLPLAPPAVQVSMPFDVSC